MDIEGMWSGNQGVFVEFYTVPHPLFTFRLVPCAKVFKLHSPKAVTVARPCRSGGLTLDCC